MLLSQYIYHKYNCYINAFLSFSPVCMLDTTGVHPSNQSIHKVLDSFLITPSYYASEHMLDGFFLLKLVHYWNKLVRESELFSKTIQSQIPYACENSNGQRSIIATRLVLTCLVHIGSDLS